MSKFCEVTGRGPMSGNHVSHAKNRVRRRFLPNLQRHRFYIPSEKRYISLRVSVRGMRTIDKLGIENVLATIKKRKQEAATK